jgi:hypothetical protein
MELFKKGAIHRVDNIWLLFWGLYIKLCPREYQGFGVVVSCNRQKSLQGRPHSAGAAE